MKNFKQTIMLMLVCALGFLASCSDEEDVFYYSFKSIEYTMEEEDGIMKYETPWHVYNSVVNNSSTEMEDIKVSLGNLYRDYYEYYVFKCDYPETFNPTVGYVHVPLPSGLAPDGTVLVSSTMGEYSMEKMITYDTSAGMREYSIPAQKRLILECSLEIEKQVFTYKATFQRHPRGEDLVVKGKFIHAKPISSMARQTLEDIE